jgi:predicted dehydrogenase
VFQIQRPVEEVNKAVMKVLIVGAGGMGQAWARNIASNDRCSLVGWVDSWPDAARAATEKLGFEGVVWGQDLERVAAETLPDFVVNVTSPEAHCEITLRSLAIGLPILGEKPMAVNIQEARSMVEASARAGKLCMISQSRRYDPGLISLRQGISKNLGRLGSLDVDFYIGAHFGGFRDEMESPLLLDMAIHTFDEARFLSGADPISVIADEYNPVWSWYKGSASASAVFEMSNGLRFNYRGSWCAEGLSTSWDGDWRAVGEFGSALWKDNGDVTLALAESSDAFIRPTKRSTVEQNPVDRGIAGSLNEFLNALEFGSTPQCEASDNIKSLAMVLAAKEASRTGSRTTVEW